MRVTSIIFLSIAAITNGKLRNPSSRRSLVRGKKDKKVSERDPFKVLERPALFDEKPENVGKLHNEVLTSLSEEYAEQSPGSNYDLMVDVGKAMSSSLCPKEDSFCDAFVYKTTLDEFYTANKGGKIEYPEGFNSDIKELLEATETTVSSLSENNVDAVVDELSVIMDDLKDMKRVPKDEKALAIASVSVAKGSTEFWTQAYTDENHNMHRHLTGRIREVPDRRRLDDTETAIIVIEVEGRYWDNIFQLIVGSTLADFFGSIRGALHVIKSVPQNPSLVWPWNWPGALVSVAIFHSIPASASFAIGTNSTAVIPDDVVIPTLPDGL